jgi:NHLM bacteriocin system ABC transporter peptidase/ATP-binding protein
MALESLRALWQKAGERWPGRAPRVARTPTILQMEAVECGAACLAIVLARYGRWVALEELRLACGVSRDGSKASNVVKAAKSYGLDARGFKMEPAALRKVACPAILHWNFNHFVVLEGFRQGRVFLNDPASGPRTVSEEELDLAFTGVVLTFKPAEGFARSGAPARILPALERRLAGNGAALAFVLLASLAVALPALLAPVFGKIFVDSVLVERKLDWLSPLLVAMALTGILLGLATWLQQAHLLRLETRLSLGASSGFFRHVLRLPVEFFNQRFAGDIAMRVQANDRVAQLLTRDLAINTVGLATCLLFAFLLVRYDPWMAATTVLVAAANAVALSWVSRRRVDGNRRLIQEQAKLSGTAIGGLAIIETLKATSGESDLFARWSGYQAKVVNQRQQLERYNRILDAVPPLLVAVNAAAVLGLGSLRVMEGTLTLGGLVACQALVAAFLAPINRLVHLGGQVQLIEGDMNRLDDVLRYPVREAAVPAEGAPEKLEGQVELRGVSFGYSRLEPPLLEGLDLLLRPGSRVALVGGSGSGKSTIARLVAGLHAPWSGQVLLDGRPLEQLPERVRTASVAAVDQEIFLFAGSVRENLTLWDATVPYPLIVQAARDAAIHDEIAARPGGYDGPVEEGGANWSGGQRQRLEIARALVAAPSVLLLDEATSALDPTTEQRIDQALRRRGCTCLIVAHRLSTIRDADEILVLERGKVVQRGTHVELAAVEGPYQRLVSAEAPVPAEEREGTR